jgi:hypothetical protein
VGSPRGSQVFPADLPGKEQKGKKHSVSDYERYERLWVLLVLVQRDSRRHLPDALNTIVYCRCRLPPVLSPCTRPRLLSMFEFVAWLLQCPTVLSELTTIAAVCKQGHSLIFCNATRKHE